MTLRALLRGLCVTVALAATATPAGAQTSPPESVGRVHLAPEARANSARAQVDLREACRHRWCSGFDSLWVLPGVGAEWSATRPGWVPRRGTDVRGRLWRYVTPDGPKCRVVTGVVAEVGWLTYLRPT